jgi:hypothetical protein
VTSQRVSPSAPPVIGTVAVPERIGCRPVSRAERLGVHWASTLKFNNRTPWAASASMRGVGAPRSTPPP